MMSWFYNLNVLSALLLIFIICGTISMIGFFISQKYFLKETHLKTISLAQKTGLTFGTLFMAFWITINWQTLKELTLTTEQEAHAIYHLYSISKMIPETNEQTRVREAVLNYLDIIINKEYRSLEQGKLSIQGEESFNNLTWAVYSYPKMNDFRDQFTYSQLIAALTSVSDNRVKRLNFVHGELTGALLIFFITLIVIICFWNGFIRSEHSKLAFVVLLSQNLIILSSAWLVLEIDHPFQGYFKVDDSAFIHTHQQIIEDNLRSKNK